MYPQSGYGFFCGKNLKTVLGTSFFFEKVIIIFVVRRLVPWKVVMPHKMTFHGYFGKYCWFLWKNCYMKNIQNLNAYKKDYFDRMTSASQNRHVFPQIVFCSFYYASIRSLSLRHNFLGCFFDISSAISRWDTTIEQHYSRRKWSEGGRKEHKAETR